MTIRSIGIVGHGHFGAFMVTLAKRFLPEVEVRVYSRRSEPDGELFSSLEDTAASDVLILCGSIAGYEEQLLSVLPYLGEETVVLDVATVKKHTSDLFKKHLGDRPWLSCHPMFGMESYKKQDQDVSGFRIVVTDKTISDNEFEMAREFLTGLGFLVIGMTADEHDKLLADTLFLTHYIGQTVKQGGFERTPVDSVSFGSLMNAVESVQHDEKLFHDVFQFNPYCRDAAKRFHDAQDEVYRNLPEV